MKCNGLKKMMPWVLCMVLVVSMALFATGCGDKTATEPTTVTTIEEGKTYGQGAAAFTLTVVDPDGKAVSAQVCTDKTTVGEALAELNLIAGEKGQYGLMVSTVNGITLDYEKDGMYWALYINGEYATTGADSTAITAGATYTWKAE